MKREILRVCIAFLVKKETFMMRVVIRYSQPTKPIKRNLTTITSQWMIALYHFSIHEIDLSGSCIPGRGSTAYPILTCTFCLHTDIANGITDIRT